MPNTGLGEVIFDRNLSFMTRWHQKPNMGFPESMAEHAGWVQRIVMYLASEYKAHGGEEEIDWRLLYETAQTHDDPEQLTGDIPGSFKANAPEAAEQIMGWELAAVQHLFGGLTSGDVFRSQVDDFIRNRSKRLEFQMIHIADKLTALSYAHTQVLMGNTLFNRVRQSIAMEALGLFKQYGWFKVIDSGDDSLHQYIWKLAHGDQTPWAP